MCDATIIIMISFNTLLSTLYTYNNCVWLSPPRGFLVSLGISYNHPPYYTSFTDATAFTTADSAASLNL